MMEVKVLHESNNNFLAVLCGMGLAFDKTVESMEKGLDIFDPLRLKDEYNDLYHQMLKRAKIMAFKGGGHNKFLRGIHLDLIVKADIGWWAQQATYTTTDAVQSTSTMHMLQKSGLENGVDPDVDPIILNRFKEILDEGHSVDVLKKNLPSGYLYIRTIHLNYLTLQHMIGQRKKHRLPEWREFCRQILEQVDHPYFLVKEE